MRDLCTIFEEAERNSSPRMYSDEDLDDPGIPFSRALEIAEQDSNDSSMYDDE